MMKAIDVARYIVNYSHDKGYDISNLRLQKLLYFVQSYCLAFTSSHEPCFSERIEAWDFGPVVPSVYHEFKMFGNGNIPRQTVVYEGDKNNVWAVQRVEISGETIPQKDRKLIEQVVDHFAKFSTAQLLTLVHGQRPWKVAYRCYDKAMSSEEIKQYFLER